MAEPSQQQSASTPPASEVAETTTVSSGIPTESTAGRSEDAQEPERKRGRADGPLPADAYSAAHGGRPHAESTRKKRDVYGDLALEKMAPRPAEFGSVGQVIRLYANLFEMRLKEENLDRPLYHYDVDFIIPPRGDGGAGRQKKISRAQAWELWQQLASSNPEIAHYFKAVAFDGLKNAFSPVKIPLKSNPHTDQTYSDRLTEGHLLCIYKEGKRERDLWVSFGLVGGQAEGEQILPRDLVRFTAPLSSEDHEAMRAGRKAPLVIQALDILLRHDVHRRYPILAGQGRKFYNPSNPGSITPIPKGGEIMRGIFQSVRPTISGVKVLMNAPYSAFVKGGRLDLVAAELVGKSGGGHSGGFNNGGRGRGGYGGGMSGGRGNGGDLDERDWRVVMKFLKKARIRLKHRDAGEYEIKGITRESASQRSFTLQHKVRRGEPEPDPPIPDEEINVADYFARKLNIHLERPFYPCVEIRGRQLIPVELCELLPGQPVPFLLTSPEQTAAIIKAAGKGPQQRRREIEDARKEASYHNEAGPDGGAERLTAWGVEVSTEMTKVMGRILPPPRVMLGSGAAQVRFGKFNLINAKFLKPNKPLQSWAVLNFDRDIRDGDIQSFVGTLVQAGTAAGMQYVERFPRIVHAQSDIKNDLKAAGKACIMRSEEQYGQRIPPQLVLCIVPDRYAAESRSIYEAVKRIALMELPIPLITQCMKASKIRQAKPNAALQYCGNLSTKINLKLSGANWTLDKASLPIPSDMLICGADIAHAAPGSRGASVASVVAATDASLSDWKSEIRVQDAGVEVIAGLDDIVFRLLDNYRTVSRQEPKSLVFYRDGVSEGEFKQVVEVEVAGVRAACERFSPGSNIRITYIVCGKRHKTRLFSSPQDQNLCDRNGNLPAGTVVDRSITSPNVFDFYLQAHSGLLGTAKPTHYIVLHDENAFTADRIQQLSNSLCWLFGRATMGVSLVTPAYLADLACARARLLIAEDFSDASTTLSSGNEQPALYLDPMKISDRLNLNGEPIANGWFI